MELLRDSNVRRIGLWEMAIIKKTTVMQNLNNNVNVAKMFDIVIWVCPCIKGMEFRKVAVCNYRSTKNEYGTHH